jgi:hypothetical protein
MRFLSRLFAHAGACRHGGKSIGRSAESNNGFGKENYGRCLGSARIPIGPILSG